MLSQKQLIDLLDSNSLIFTEYPQDLFNKLCIIDIPLIYNAHYLNNIKNKIIFIRNLQHIKFHQKINISEGELIFKTEKIIKIKGIDGIHEYEIIGYELEKEFKEGDYLFINHLNKTIQKLGLSSNLYSNKIELYIPLKKTNKIIDQMKLTTLYEIDLLIEKNTPNLEYNDIKNETNLIIKEYLEMKSAEIIKKILIIENYEYINKEIIDYINKESFDYFFIIKITNNKEFYDKWNGSKTIWELK